MAVNQRPPDSSSVPPASQRLDSWKEIAAYLKRDIRSLQRWEKNEGLPVHRHMHGKQGSVYAYTAEIDAWWNNGRPHLEAEELSTPLEPESTHASNPEPEADHFTHILAWFRRGWPWAIVLLVFLAAGAMLFRYSRATRPNPVPVSKIVPLTGNAGWERHPAFSPDGKQIAFTSDRTETADNSDIYVKMIGTGVPLRLTNHTGLSFSPTWSPDGSYIAFLRNSDGGGSDLFVAPALGGPERKLGHLAASKYVFGDPQYPKLSWSPNGKFLAVIDKASLQEPDSIFLLSTETGRKQRLTSPPAMSNGDAFPAFSPDGQTLAFTRKAPEADICKIAVTAEGQPSGEPRRLTFDGASIAGLDWTPDGHEIVFSSTRLRGNSCLWKVSASGGVPTQLLEGREDVFSLASSRRGPWIAYAHVTMNTEIWRMRASSSRSIRSEAPQNSPTRLIFSNGLDWAPQFSPDGTKIAFMSDRSGNSEIWVSDCDGLHPLQLTSSGQFADRFRWSPDSRRIVVHSAKGIAIIGLDGALPQLAVAGPGVEYPSWSRDGKWIYFSSNRSGGWQVWKAPTEGGTSIQITQGGGFETFESPDGKFVFYDKNDAPGIWRVSALGGHEELVVDHGVAGSWTMLENGIYVLNPDTIPFPRLELFSFATRRMVPFATLPRAINIAANFKVPLLSVSPDRREILYVQAEHLTSAIELVENFQ